MSDQYIRYVQTSVTNFLVYDDYYLFVKRNSDRKVDPGRLNGIGGRLESGETFLEAAIRETKEETGYDIVKKDVQFIGIVKVEGGYEEDWVMSFFKITVKDKNIPIGDHNHEGKFIWLHKDSVLNSEYELVDDLNYCFPDIVKGDKLLFITAKLNKEQKIIEIRQDSL